MTKTKFEIWFNELKKSGKTNREIGEILAGVAKYSSLAIYEAIIVSLTDKDMEMVEKIEGENEAVKEIEKLFKIRTGMSIDELVGKVQMYLIEGK